MCAYCTKFDRFQKEGRIMSTLLQKLSTMEKLENRAYLSYARSYAHYPQNFNVFNWFT
jgi:hypothetical protein